MYRHSHHSPKDYVIAIVFFLVSFVIWFFCVEYLPDKYTYGWIAAVPVGIVIAVGLYHLYLK